MSPEMVHGNSLSLSGNQTSPFPLVTSSLLNGTPQEGTIKLNTDRAAKNIPGTGGLGGVFRDHNDKWLLDFYESLAHTSPVEAELKAIRRGLQLAIQHNFMHLQVETDSKEAVEGIMSVSFFITLKLKETVAGLQNALTPTPTLTNGGSIGLPELPPQQPPPLLKKEEYQPSDSLKITIEENVHTVEEGPKSPESEWVISI